MVANFKLVAGTVLLIALGNVLSAPSSSSKDKGENIFLRTLQNLHKGPPQQKPQSRITPEDKWIEQPLDHFNELEKRTWRMRYLENDEFFAAGGPIFIFIGGEWTIDEGPIVGGHVYDMAKEHKGYLFYTEHRYYGKSRPLPDLTNDNLQYLSVQQALADLAHFIRTVRSTYPGMSSSTKVIVVGGSYSATMATWFRKLYPDLATGAWASSAPLEAKVNFFEYKEITGQSIRLLGGDSCYTTIQNGVRALEQLIAENRGAEVKAMLNLCDSFKDDNDLDIWSLFSSISDTFAGVVQYHNDWFTPNIHTVCAEVQAEESPLVGLAKFIRRSWRATQCNDVSYKGMVEYLSDSAYSEMFDNSYRPWIYQTCNEYGWYQTSGSRAQPFGSSFPRDLYLQMCEDVFGRKFSIDYIYDQVAATNEQFEGKNIAIDNVYQTHGHLDPWRAMGIQEGEHVAVIPNASHCADLSSIDETYDNAEMLASKNKISALVRQWLAA